MNVKYRYIWMLISVFGILAQSLFASPGTEDVKAAAAAIFAMLTARITEKNRMDRWQRIGHLPVWSPLQPGVLR